jgi:hypothetical protein
MTNVRRKRNRAWLAALSGLAVAGSLAATAPASAAPNESTVDSAAAVDTAGRPTEPSLVGAGEMRWLAGERVYFRVDARGFLEDARGSFRIEHTVDGVLHWADAEVDCLLTGGPVATFTAVVTDSNVPELVNTRRGLSVYDDGRRDRVGYSWLDAEQPVGKCLGAAPFLEARTGDFVVRHWSPPIENG